MTQHAAWGGSLTGCLILGPDCVVRRINATALGWLGYVAEEVMGQPLQFLLGSGGQLFLQSQILPTLRFKGGLEEIYLRLRSKSGGNVSVLVNLGPLTGSSEGEIEFSFMRIPQRGQLEDELVQAKKLAEQASDAKTKFLGMMSHEVRTPLQVISFNNQMIVAGDYGPLSPDMREVMESSLAATESVGVLIDDILNFARMQGGPMDVSPEDIPMGRALDRTETSIRHQFQLAGLDCRREKAGDDLVVRGDPQRLQQVLLNLVNNALKFTPRDGIITLATRRSGGFGIFDVTDTGSGIPAEHLQRVFEPFVQLHTTIESADKPGVGLGLAICRDLVRAMEGSIEVKSSVGVGSTFSVALPLAEGSPRQTVGATH